MESTRRRNVVLGALAVGGFSLMAGAGYLLFRNVGRKEPDDGGATGRRGGGGTEETP